MLDAGVDPKAALATDQTAPGCLAATEGLKEILLSYRHR
jgi:hypothetical protein